eukprot:12753031-Alexandrium_andersonii.AAC.1
MGNVLRCLRAHSLARNRGFLLCACWHGPRTTCQSKAPQASVSTSDRRSTASIAKYASRVCDPATWICTWLHIDNVPVKPHA